MFSIEPGHGRMSRLTRLEKQRVMDLENLRNVTRPRELNAEDGEHFWS